MAAPTENDYRVFNSISDSNRYKIIKGYLWLNNTQVEVGREVFPYEEDRSCGEKVSSVMRCYGFGGENHGIFRKWGISNTVKDSDIKSFVAKYPNGCRYDGNGTDMFRFLKQAIDRRLEAERAQRQREQAAVEAQRMAEAEERRRQQAIEAEERRYQEQLRKQQEEEERRVKEHRRKQDELRNRALSMAGEAEELMSSASNYEELSAGIEKYRQAMSICWKEFDSYFGTEQDRHVEKSNVFLSSCERIALYEYNNKNYQNVLRYGNYACDIPRTGASEDDIFLFNYDFTSLANQRNQDFHPEVTCLSLMAEVCMNMNNIGEAIRFAEYGTKIGSIRCMEILGDYYLHSSQKEDILLSCYYFEMMGKINDSALLKKRSEAQNKVIAFRADEVEKVMYAYSPNWLPAPHNSTDTWEEYSNLSNEVLSKYDRESKNKNVIIPQSPNTASCFERFGYIPGQIDLSLLWEVYKAAHTKTERKMLFFKKNEYIGELREGDFVECCRYLWKKDYQSERNPNVSVNSSMFGHVSHPLKENQLYEEPELPALEPELPNIELEPQIDDEKIRKEKAMQLFKKALICKKNKDNKGMLDAYLEAVNYGSAEAANNLGGMYKVGNGVERDFEKAVSLFEQSASQGNAVAMRNLAKCYLEGVGVEKDFEKAISLLTESAESGDINSGLELIKIYANWSHKDDSKRLFWLKKVADLGNVDCMFDLGELYAKNNEFIDYDEALKYYELAAGNGADEMKLKVAQALDVQKYSANGCVNLDAAKKWYLEVIDGTNDKLKLDAAKGLDTLYSDNGEVLREALDVAKAFETYRMLGSIGNKEALAEAAYCKEMGKGTEQDINLAIAYYEQAGYKMQAELCKKKKAGNMNDEAYFAHKDCTMPPLIRNKHTNNNEYYLDGKIDNISEYESKIYYISKSYEMPAYLCVSNNDGTEVGIIAELADDYSYANVHVNITGIYVYIMQVMQDFGKVQIAHYSFSGTLLSECKEKYPGGDENGHHIEEICFYDSRAYYVYYNDNEITVRAHIKCMDIDNNQVFTVYEKASEICRLFAIKDKLVFNAIYANDDCKASWQDGWMILDLNSMSVECISHPLCNPENVIDDPEIYDEESPRYSNAYSHDNRVGKDRKIIAFDFNRNIFWTERKAIEGADSKHLQIIWYREPRRLWGDRDAVIPDMPIWRIDDDILSGRDGDIVLDREYFDGVHRYWSEDDNVFKSADMYGNIYSWSDDNGGHGECDQFKVRCNYLFLNVDAYGEKQYDLTIEKSEAIRKSWFDRELDQEIIDAFNGKISNSVMVSEALKEKETIIPAGSEVMGAIQNDHEEALHDTNVNSELVSQIDNPVGLSVITSDLSVDKVIGNTDVKYNICTFGSKFHIGFGIPVTIEINGKTYECKTHNSTKGRIDGMKKLFTENDIKLGDCLEANYYQANNRVVLVKK